MKRFLLAVPLLLIACQETEVDDGLAEITVTVTVPEETPNVYLAGSAEALGPWDADGAALSGDRVERTATLRLPEGQRLEYKFTLGDWAREAVDENGFPYPNFSLETADGLEVDHVLAGFKPERDTLLNDWQGSGVKGTLVYWRDVESVHLEPTRNVEIWLPPGYDAPENEARRYPVIYMTDGENLFDPRIANTGVDWGMDEAMMHGVEAGLFEPAIIVAHWSTRRRLEEYSPWHDGPQLARFVIEELKPRVDGAYRTLPDRENTFAMGSSMGGLNAMYLLTQHGKVFSACGCISTHVPLSENMVAAWQNRPTAGTNETPYLLLDLEEDRFAIPEGARMFFDYGTATLDVLYPEPHGKLRDYLIDKGYTDGEDFYFREYTGAEHNEAAWRARVMDQLIWVLGQQIPPVTE